ncbi:PTS galactosamine/N-acetylgalactosamine transporter subunit IIA [Erysipelothrix rhusiopathiae]|uniref:PTS system fructose IIA component n=2 Tax=Erysipelothrix TaxID=1647 RepID=E7FVY8_ERYRH|nr:MULTISPECIES: PTS galactosamine/N-acetylgalactosamine transporter subunit IIA [Erysipelothrix]CAH2763203.1 PTS sugar transporter subunit IIA [Erysipelothrix sp. A18Y020d]AGN24441.1 PTS system transporter subunit IIA [Erysipelothrix rhusiopathiae SY1027]AMS10810.1 PTS sugar transporter [Erysipelothrix rhusiopathiae]AOO66918.1 PTS sugar transporter [Erysipelothrix rhusiopathiae]AWU41823.1 PTS sugar transporter [Erysipelothrix rhusiopathiae]
MIGIIVTGHGRFAEGLSSSVELIAGAQPQYKSVLFLEESGPEKLSSDLKEAIAEVNTGEGVLVFTDLKGGTPFKESVMIAMNHTDVHVLAGTNLPMLLEASLMRLSEPAIYDFAKSLAETGASQVELFEMPEAEEASDDFSDGI